MAPELTDNESDVSYGEGVYEGAEDPNIPNLTKETDVFAFAMVPLEVNNLLAGLQYSSALV
jgi:hypothetical protein